MLIKNKLFFSVIFFCLFVITSCRQQVNKIDDKNLPQRIAVSVKDSVLLSLDKSPMDMIYFPEDYPKQKMMNPTLANPVARAIYSRPQKKGNPSRVQRSLLTRHRPVEPGCQRPPAERAGTSRSQSLGNSAPGADADAAGSRPVGA